MGIDKFHKWLSKTYPSSVSNDEGCKYYDNVYIDINCLLHRVISGSLNERILFCKLYSCIDNILVANVPIKRLVLAVDGTAPFAKILLQRKRRLKLSRNMDAENVTYVNPLQFTPGTKFMKSLPEKISKYIKKIELTYKISVEFRLGSGEAEFKLMSQILSRVNENHLIISTDADVIIMACALNIRNIRVNNLKYIISIDELLRSHKIKMGLSKKYDSGKDFMFISLFLGNDYLPKLNFVNADKLWNAYKYACEICKNNVSVPLGCFLENNLNYEFLKIFLRKLVVDLAKKWINRFEIRNYDPNMYQKYIDGLKWCSLSYTTGTCDSIDYMYNFESPHPFGLIFYLESELDKIKKVTNNDLNTEKVTVPEDIYAILVLPKSSLHLLDKKYHKIDSCLDFLYTEELCPNCIEFYENLRNLHKNLAQEKSDVTRKNITKLVSKIGKHKATHKDIGIKEINFAINYLTKLVC